MGTVLRHGVVLLALSLGLSACEDRPSGSQARRAFEQDLRAKLGTTPYRILAFEKTNGATQSIWGVEHYMVSYRARVSFPEGIHPECYSPNDKFMGFNCYNQSLMGLPPRPANGIIDFDRTLAFRKTERGWMLAQ